MDKARLKVALQELSCDSSLEVKNGFKMLIKHYYSEGQLITAANLSKAAGYDSYEVANKQYGSFARKFSEKSGIKSPVLRDAKPVWTFALCDEIQSKQHQTGYVWKLRSEIAEALQELGIVKVTTGSDVIADIREAETKFGSEKYCTSIIQARIGQGRFRASLINYWEGCVLTGCSEEGLLVASHIKPWNQCSPQEALSMTNGLLLIPNLDKAFDKGFISFNSNGGMLISKNLSDVDLQLLGIDQGLSIPREKYTSEHDEFMSFHRNNIFQNNS